MCVVGVRVSVSDSVVIVIVRDCIGVIRVIVSVSSIGIVIGVVIVIVMVIVSGMVIVDGYD